jgi:CrcB protein
MGVLVVLGVALGGFVGAPARLFVDRFVSGRLRSELPVGTFLINISGSFLLGVLTGLGLENNLPELVKALIGTGFCGAYTTFSTWSFETVRLVERGDYLEAGLNAFGSLVIGLLACAAGIALGTIH